MTVPTAMGIVLLDPPDGAAAAEVEAAALGVLLEDLDPDAEDDGDAEEDNTASSGRDWVNLSKRLDEAPPLNHGSDTHMKPSTIT